MASVTQTALSSNLPATQPKTKKKTKEDIKFYEARYAGFPITLQVALEWANRIRAQLGHPSKQKVLTDDPIDRAKILLTLDDVVKEAGGIECNFYGARKPDGFENYIIVTSRQFGEFYKINGEKPPGSELIDPEGEEMGKKLLAQEGIEHGPFTTCFCNF